jgi:type I restriction enzyme S subunit
MSAGVDVMPLGEVVRPTRPRVKPADHAALPFIGMEHIEAHTMKLLGTVPAATMKSSAVYFKPGDVLYGRLRPYLNKVYRPAFEGLCSAEFIVLPETERLDGKYLQYFLNSGAFVRFASHLNAGDRPRVDFDQIAVHEIPLPRVDVQRRIVAEIEKQFSRLDEAVANLQRAKANLKRYTTAVLGAAVGGGLVPTEAALAKSEGRAYESGENLLRRVVEARKSQWEGKGKFSMPEGPRTSELPSLPDGWMWATATQACDAVVDCHNKTAPYVAVGIPLVRTTNIRDGRLLFEDMRYVDQPTYDFWSRRCPPKSGDVLFTREAPMGEAAIIPPGLKICLGQRTMLMRPSAAVDKGFLLAALMSPVVRRLIDRVAVGSGVKHLRVGDVERIPVPLPPLAEQHRIVAEVDRRLSIVRAVAAEVDLNLVRATKLRNAVLTVALGRTPLESGT